MKVTKEPTGNYSFIDVARAAADQPSKEEKKERNIERNDHIGENSFEGESMGAVPKPSNESVTVKKEIQAENNKRHGPGNKRPTFKSLRVGDQDIPLTQEDFDTLTKIKQGGAKAYSLAVKVLSADYDKGLELIHNFANKRKADSSKKAEFLTDDGRYSNHVETDKDRTDMDKTGSVRPGQTEFTVDPKSKMRFDIDWHWDTTSDLSPLSELKDLNKRNEPKAQKPDVQQSLAADSKANEPEALPKNELDRPDEKTKLARGFDMMKSGDPNKASPSYSAYLDKGYYDSRLGENAGNLGAVADTLYEKSLDGKIHESYKPAELQANALKKLEGSADEFKGNYNAIAEQDKAFDAKKNYAIQHVDDLRADLADKKEAVKNLKQQQHDTRIADSAAYNEARRNADDSFEPIGKPSGFDIKGMFNNDVVPLKSSSVNARSAESIRDEKADAIARATPEFEDKWFKSDEPEKIIREFVEPHIRNYYSQKHDLAQNKTEDEIKAEINNAVKSVASAFRENDDAAISKALYEARLPSTGETATKFKKTLADARDRFVGKQVTKNIVQPAQEAYGKDSAQSIDGMTGAFIEQAIVKRAKGENLTSNEQDVLDYLDGLAATSREELSGDDFIRLMYYNKVKHVLDPDELKKSRDERREASTALSEAKADPYYKEAIAQGKAKAGEFKDRKIEVEKSGNELTPGWFGITASGDSSGALHLQGHFEEVDGKPYLAIYPTEGKGYSANTAYDPHLVPADDIVQGFDDNGNPVFNLPESERTDGEGIANWIQNNGVVRTIAETYSSDIDFMDSSKKKRHAQQLRESGASAVRQAADGYTLEEAAKKVFGFTIPKENDSDYAKKMQRLGNTVAKKVIENGCIIDADTQTIYDPADQDPEEFAKSKGLHNIVRPLTAEEKENVLAQARQLRDEKLKAYIAKGNKGMRYVDENGKEWNFVELPEDKKRTVISKDGYWVVERMTKDGTVKKSIMQRPFGDDNSYEDTKKKGKARGKTKGKGKTNAQKAVQDAGNYAKTHSKHTISELAKLVGGL